MSTYHCPTDCTQRPLGAFSALIARERIELARKEHQLDARVYIPTLLEVDGSVLPDHIQQHCTDCFIGFGVHNTHCCKRHGCKYCDSDCPVEFSDAPGIICEDCQDNERNYPYELERITGLSVNEFEQLKADAQSWRLHRESIATDPTSL